MAYWLFKSEPEVWGWHDQVKAGAAGTEWTGVRNYQARNFMRAMAIGDRGFFYHSGGAKEIVGIVEIVKAIHPDTTDDGANWECVDVAAVGPLAASVGLAAIKNSPALTEMALVRNSRLSVQPVTDSEWAAVLAMAGDGGEPRADVAPGTGSGTRKPAKKPADGLESKAADPPARTAPKRDSRPARRAKAPARG